MIEYKLNIGEVVTSSRDVIYACQGLGSCIGLFLEDRMAGLSGGAHIFLPESERDSSGCSNFYGAEHAIQEIRRQLKHHGSTLEGLRAKVTGGANVINLSSPIGVRNAESVLKELVRHRIYVATVDVGGIHCRTARFESVTGLLTVKIPQTNQYRIY